MIQAYLEKGATMHLSPREYDLLLAISELRECGCEITSHHTPSHTGIAVNEAADTLAEEGRRAYLKLREANPDIDATLGFLHASHTAVKRCNMSKVAEEEFAIQSALAAKQSFSSETLLQLGLDRKRITQLLKSIPNRPFLQKTLMGILSHSRFTAFQRGVPGRVHRLCEKCGKPDSIPHTILCFGRGIEWTDIQRNPFNLIEVAQNILDHKATADQPDGKAWNGDLTTDELELIPEHPPQSETESLTRDG